MARAARTELTTSMIVWQSRWVPDSSGSLENGKKNTRKQPQGSGRLTVIFPSPRAARNGITYGIIYRLAFVRVPDMSGPLETENPREGTHK